MKTVPNNNTNENKKLNWEEIENEGTLDNFSAEIGLKPECVNFEKDVLILPRNTHLMGNPDTQDQANLYPAGTKELVQAFISNGVNAELYSDDRDKRDLILKGADIVLPILLFVGSSAVGVGLNILSNWIYDRFVKTKNAEDPLIKVEYAEVDSDRRIVKWRRIEAPASQLYVNLSEEAGLKMETERSMPLKTTGDEEEVDDWATRCQSEARVAHEVAEELIREARKLLDEQDQGSSEKLARRALQKLREACLWEPNLSDHMKYLHYIGKFVHDQFGCLLEYNDHVYWVTCPVHLSHSKGGFSIGGSGRVICSICDKEMIDCPHVKGQRYNNVVAKHYNGICNICGKEECRQHDGGKTYDAAKAFGIVTEMRLDHVSFVEKPSNPLCVVQKYTIPSAEILQTVPEEERSRIVPGQTPVYCHHCLICDGTKDDG